MSAIAEFKKGDPVVYPAHGVGEVVGIITLDIAGTKEKCYNIVFRKDNMKLSIPVRRAEKANLRAVGNEETIERAIKTMKGSARAARGMWSRRAQEYQNKINSGDLNLAAQVVRDLHKNVDDPERSYSERVIYESALERLACEFSVVRDTAVEQSTAFIETILKSKNVRPANSDKAEINELANDNAAAIEEFDLFGTDADILAAAS